MENNVIKVANDLGYGAVKAKLNDENIEFPSVMAVERAQDISAPIQFDNKQQQDNYFKDFINHMDVTISSSAIKQQGRFLIGNAALESRLPLTQFDINDQMGKSQSDLSLILTLSMIAGKRVKDAYKDGIDLSETLKAEVIMATALPVIETKRTNARDAYAGRYTNATHTVTFHNFQNPITVSIKFKKVFVAVEGETAQLYISFGNDKKLIDGLKKDYETNYASLSQKQSIDEFISAKNVISFDIGAGTTDITAIINGKANPYASVSVPYGYGSVLEDAVDVLQEQQYPISNRSQLEEFLAEKNVLNKAKHARVEKIVNEQFETLADRIVNAGSRSLRKAGAEMQASFISGGGAIPMKESQLREKITAKINSYSGGFADIPVLWVPKEYSQKLNCLGLEMVTNRLSKGED